LKKDDRAGAEAMTSWAELAPSLGLVHAPDPSSPLSRGSMAGTRAGHRVRIEQLDEYRRTARTVITLAFEAPLPARLLVRASAAARAQAHWLWAAVAGVFFAGGIGGALAAQHPGPLVVCLGGALVLWGWIAARRSSARRGASGVRLGDPALDGILHVETDDPGFARSRLGSRRARDILSALAASPLDLELTEREIRLVIDRPLDARAELELELDRLTELAGLLTGRR
jgi:hypothetical protein